MRLIDPDVGRAKTMIPLIGMTQAGAGRFFNDEGMPSGGPGWEEVEFPDLGEREGVRPRGQGDSMEPLYRDGDVLIVSPTASMRQGRPRRGAHDGRRGHCEGAQAPDRKEHRAALPQRRAPGPRDPRERDRLDGARDVGAAVAITLQRGAGARPGTPGARASDRRRARGRSGSGLGDAVERDEGAEARPAVVAEQDLVDRRNQACDTPGRPSGLFDLPEVSGKCLRPTS